MERLIVEGGRRITGEMRVHGAKNSSLPILAASLLSGGETVLHNVPRLSDVDAAIEILRYLGCSVSREGDTVVINSDRLEHMEIPENLMHEMRSSIVFLGPMVSRLSRARLSFPGAHKDPEPSTRPFPCCNPFPAASKPLREFPAHGRYDIGDLP